MNIERESNEEENEIPQQIIDAMKGKGVNDKDTREMVESWIEEQKKLAVNDEDKINLNINLFNLYMSVADRKNAEKFLVEAWKLADNVGNTGLKEEIKEKLQEFN